MKRQGLVQSEEEEIMGRHTLVKNTAPLLAIGMFLVSLGVGGNGGVGWASNETGPLQIEQGRVSGTVTQLPLQLLLDQFQEQAGIEYKASKEELAKPVSVALQQASIQEALEKILATWDYALTRDRDGHIQHIFVLRKILAGGTEEQTIKAEASRRLPAQARKGRNSARSSMDEPHVGVRDARAEHSVVMEEAGMELTQVPDEEQQAIVQELEAANEDSFDPEMDITLMAEGEQQAIVQALESATGETFSAEMEITDMSEGEQQAIIQALESSP